MSILRCVVCGLVVLAAMPSDAFAQDSASAFVTGDCPRRDPAPDLTTVVSTPDTPPVLQGKPPKTPRFVLEHGYRGRVLVAFVVDAKGRVEKATAVVVESTDPRLSEWICKQVGSLRFRPAVLAGEPVRAQAAMPFEYSARVIGRP